MKPRSETGAPSYLSRAVERLPPGRSGIGERHRRPWANVQMDDPTVAVVTHASSTSAERLSHTEAAGLNVSRTTVEVLRVSSTTDTTVVVRRAVPRDDTERPSVERPEALEYLDELGRDLVLTAAPVLSKLPLAEMLTKVTHDDRD